MEVYLDNAATTKILDSAKKQMMDVLSVDYGNPSSIHSKGMEAEQYIKEAKLSIAKSLKVDPKEIIFTSGGTESNNLAIIGAAMANKRNGNHIITTNIEHPSVHEPFKYLEEQGFRISFVPVHRSGHIIEEELLKLISQDTILVSMIYVNNEIGAVQDINKLSLMLKNINPDVLIHVDGVQAYGKYMIFPKREGIDLFSISAHKFHGPKGIGALFVNTGVKIKPILFGGSHEKGMRPGTENVPGIAGFGQVVKEIFIDHNEKIARMYELKQRFLREIIKIEDIKINGVPDNGADILDEENIKKTAPHIMSVSFLKVRSEVLLHALEERGIYVSAGSACSSNQPRLSSTLQAIGLSRDLLSSTLRFSFSFDTTIEDIDFTIGAIKEILPVLRRYQPR